MEYKDLNTGMVVHVRSKDLGLEDCTEVVNVTIAAFNVGRTKVYVEYGWARIQKPILISSILGVGL